SVARYVCHSRPRFSLFRLGHAITLPVPLSLHDALPIYPVPGATTTRLYLSGQGRANSLIGDGRLIAAAPGNEPQDRYDFDPKTPDRKSTRLNSSHQIISYAVFCLKKNKITINSSSRPSK